MPVTGAASQIELTGAGGLIIALNDADSETVTSILLSNLPDGFLVFTGSSPDEFNPAPMASNAGGTGGTNTWVLLGEGDTSVPAYIAILPPQNWSGTISGLELIVTSGETTLSEALTERFPVGDITVLPVADGLTLSATSAYGTEGHIVALNLNASIDDATAAVVSSAAPDETPGETVTLELAGLGAHASFYVGTALHTEGVSYDAATDTYTLTGLRQSDLDALGVMQAAPDTGTSRTVGVTAWTVDGASTSAEETATITLNTTRQLGTSAADSLLWNGRTIDGRGGEDTVRLRIDESLDGATLAARLTSVEVLDLRIDGANGITELTPEDVRQITASGNNLTILGTAQDTVALSGDWQDNGDGTYTGTIVSGATTTEVTLTVTDAIVTTPPLIGGRMMSFGLDGADDDSFGLAATDQAADDPAPRMIEAPADGEEIVLTDLLPDAKDAGDLADLLPPDDRSAEGPGLPDVTPAREDATDLAEATLPRTTLEDELHASGMYEV